MSREYRDRIGWLAPRSRIAQRAIGLAFALCWLGGLPAQADVITFDDLDPAGLDIGTIPDGYFGFAWNGLAGMVRRGTFR